MSWFKHFTTGSKFRRAAVFYVLNRSSFSGSTFSGGMSPGHPRFTQSSMERLENFSAQNISIQCADFKESLQKHKDDFLYLDPPYQINQSLYGKKGNLHKQFDHMGLFDILNNRSNWMLSYNNGEQIKKLYDNYEIIPVNWKYGMSSDKDAREIIILSHDLS